MNNKIQYVYAPASGNPNDAKVSFGKPQAKQIIKHTTTQIDEKDDTPKLKTVGDKRANLIKTTRAKFEMTQEEFAKNIGIGKNVITLYENSSSLFNPSEWDKIIRGIDQLNKVKKEKK
jgi:ribosome-binding protein aMBF1 (putative translation factor)